MKARRLLVLTLAAGCAGPDPNPDRGVGPLTPLPPIFSDISDDAGIHFTHVNDASPRRLLPETMGSGAAFFDYDGDGRPDLYLVNGAPLVSDRSQAAPGALYHNLDGRHFADVTRAAGLIEPFYGMGVAVGDVNNDGHLDLFVSGVGASRLYLNRGDGTFADATRAWHLDDPGFATSAAFLDYDRDGRLDLYVAHYVSWSAGKDVACAPDGTHRSYCTPEVYRGESGRLYRNLGGAGFADVTAKCGLATPESKTLGVAVLDIDHDGWPDLALANDTTPNLLYVNNHDGTFAEVGVAARFAYSESGATRGGMGIDAADADGDGNDDLLVTNFAQEMVGFYRGLGKLSFADEAAPSGLGLPTLMPLGFGALFVDVDSDGLPDVVLANGHIEPDIKLRQPQQSYAQKPQLFRNLGAGRFEPVADQAGSALHNPLVGRGLAAADIDGDGDLDLVITQNGGTARLLRNDSPPRQWLRVRLQGTKSNRTGYGATVKVVAGTRSWTRTLASGRSYLSACEPVLTFGLGDVDRIDRLEISWPWLGGGVQTVADPPQRQLLEIVEPGPALESSTP